MIHILRSSLLLLISGLFSVIASGQLDCEGIEIDMFQHPFNTELLVIEATNMSQDAFNYPSWKVYYNGDEIASGEVVFFVLPEHAYFMLETTMEIVEGEDYDFTLELYTLFNEELACTYEWSGTPYQADACIEGDLHFYSSGGFIEQELELQLIDEFGDMIVNENIFFEFSQQQASFPMCLGRGCYEIRIEAVGGALENNLLVNFITQGHVWYSELATAGESEYTFEADVLEGCSFVGIPDFEARPVHSTTVVVSPQSELGGILQAGPSTSLTIFDHSGRLIDCEIAAKLKAPVSGGFYLLIYESPVGDRKVRRIYVQP